MFGKENAPSKKRQPQPAPSELHRMPPELATLTSAPETPAQLLQMQRLIGNRSVQRLINTGLIQTNRNRNRRRKKKSGTPTSENTTTPQTTAPTTEVEPAKTETPPVVTESVTPTETPAPDPIETRRTALLERVDAAITRYTDHRKIIALMISRNMPREFAIYARHVDSVLGVLSKSGYWPPSGEKFQAWRNGVAAMTTDEKLAGAETWLTNVSSALDSMESEAVKYTDWLQGNTLKAYDKMLADDETPSNIAAKLQADWNRTIELGDLKRYYKSSHDKDENFALGMSYYINNTPFVVHLHAKGSGTSLVGLSIKFAANEYGGAIVPASMLGKNYKTLQTALVDALNRHSESPRLVSVDVRSGRR